MFSGQSTLDFAGPRMGFGYDAEGRQQLPPGWLREEQDPIWDLGETSVCLLLGGREGAEPGGDWG